MIHLTYPGGRLSYDVERVQIVSAGNGNFLRVSTRPIEIPPPTYAPIRESSRRNENRWQFDGIGFNLSCRNVEFVVTSRRPIITQLLIDLYFPLNQALDVSFQQYIPSEGVFNTPFAGNAPIAERQTAVLPRSAGGAGGRQTRRYRDTAPATVPLAVRQLTQQEIENGNIANGIYDMLETPITDLIEPPQPVATPPAEQPEANFLRRFDNIVTDDMMDEEPADGE